MNFKEDEDDTGFDPISEEQCFDASQEIDPDEPLGPCTIPLWVYIDAPKMMVPF